jgi:hypothetical protein
VTPPTRRFGTPRCYRIALLRRPGPVAARDRRQDLRRVGRQARRVGQGQRGLDLVERLRRVERVGGLGGHGPLARRALLVVGPQFVLQSFGCGKLEGVVRHRFHGLQGRGAGRQEHYPTNHIR